MPNNETPNVKRAITLSAPADPRTDQRQKATKGESDKIRRQLDEMRQRNSELSANIHSLEMAIGEPAFRRLIDQVPSSADSSLAPTISSSAEPSSNSDELKKQKIVQCKKVLGAKLAKFAEKGQKLNFGVVNLQHCLPKFFVAINAENCKLIAVSIVGPPDIKKRSSGALRVADEVISLDCSLIADLIGGEEHSDQPQGKKASAKKNSPLRSSDRDNPSQKNSSAVEAAAERARNCVERALERAAEQRQPPLVVFGVLRRDAKIMALTGDWVQVQIVHLPNETEGLGFGIVGGHSTGVVVKSIIRGSVADKDMRLRPGDRILQIGHISTQGLNSQQVAALLRQQDAVVQLVVVRPIQLQNSDQDTPLCWTMATRAALSADTLDEQVQKRMETLANLRNKNCNGLHHPKCQKGLNSQTHRQEEAINEGTEYPDQLALHQHTHEHGTTVPMPTTSATTTTERHNNNNNNNTVDQVGATAQDASNQPSTSAAGIHQIWVRSEDRTAAGSDDGNSNRRRRGRTSRGPSSRDNPSCSSSTDRISLKQLQEMALTSFCRDKWTPGKFREVHIELERDKHIGLGITVAGYVYKKEEISGVFIKSLVPQSSAHLSRQIQLHDLIVEVNGRSLEGLSHAESVRTLIRSGQRVRLKLIRFEEGTPQAKCLKMLHEQELAVASQNESANSSTTTATAAVAPPIAAQSQQQNELSLVDYKSFWSARMGPEFDVIVVDVRPDERVVEDGGLGIEWQGTVDICDGSQLCSHHFIESIRKDGPAAKTGALKAGDELLQVNQTPLFGDSFVRVRNELNSAQRNCEFVRLFFCRKAEKEHLNFVMPSEQSLPLAYPILASLMSIDQHFIKAKSELRLAELASFADFESANDERSLSPTAAARRQRRTLSASSVAAANRWKRSRSLENLSGFAVWHCVPIVVTLRKDAKGLGFSVADYQVT